MQKRILLVDDDVNILDTAKDILEDAGYAVTAANTVRNALTCLEDTAFDVMITDLNFPDGSGLELAAKARTQNLHMRILLMTGQAESDQPIGLTARQRGEVDDYLVKPVHPPQLLTILHKLISG